MTRRRFGLLTVVLAGLAAGGLLVAGALQQSLTYYRTPQQVLTDSDATRQRVRLGGQVAPGSVQQDGDRVRFRLVEGGHEITVRHRGTPPGTFREGEGAVVEGILTATGTFESDHLVVRHGNEYRAARVGAEPTDAG